MSIVLTKRRLDVLRELVNKPRSLQDIGNTLEISRQAVLKHMQALAERELVKKAFADMPGSPYIITEEGARVAQLSRLRNFQG